MTQSNELALRQLSCIAADRDIPNYQCLTKEQLHDAIAEDERNRMVNRFAEIYERLNLGAVVQIAERN